MVSHLAQKNILLFVIFEVFFSLYEARTCSNEVKSYIIVETLGGFNIKNYSKNIR
jgi:hypothetical protein